MKFIEGALSRPVTVMVGVLAIAFFSVLSILKMKIDIFPTFGLPTIYVWPSPMADCRLNRWRLL